MQKILIATGNSHKIGEISEILRGYPVQLVSLRDFPSIESPDETGLTYAENAVLKARFYAEHTGLPALADDSGLEVDGLDGAPGLYSARFGGHDLPHSEKIQLVLRTLAETPDLPRSARFRCCCAYVESPAAEPVTAEASCEGQIVVAPKGLQGFGYDPIFQPEGCPDTMAELPAEAKHRISHRGKSLRQLMLQLGFQ